jgi:hypothetical protein
LFDFAPSFNLSPMSLADKKSALFGKPKGAAGGGASSAGSSSASASAPASAPASTTGSAPKLATVGSGTIDTSISPALKQKKTQEAKEWLDKGANFLKTSFMQWTPDYLAAAPCYENASNAYKAINEFDKAREALITAAEYNEKAGCMNAAAFTYSKVALICQVLHRA